MVMDHGERRNGGEAAAVHMRAVQRAPAKPWRGGGAAVAPPPPKVYRVEPRNFRELVQRLTGAATTTVATAPMGVRQAPAPAPAHSFDTAHGLRGAAAAAEQQFDYASWFLAPLLSPASMPAGFDVGRSGNGALL